MAKQLQLRRGTTAQHSTFTGAAGEVTIDTDKKVVVVHDGSTAGGTPLAKDSAKVDKVTSTDNAIVRFDGISGAVQNSSVVIDDSGNVGIGVIPSAWGNVQSQKVLQVSTAGSFGALNYGDASPYTFMSSNTYNDSSLTGRYIITAAATSYQQNVGQHQWFTAPSGTAGNAITFTQAMTLDASGDLTVPHTYSNTTASAANMFVDSAGKFYRSTSSRKYKTNIEDVEKQYVDSFFNNARPIYYKSLSENDNPNWGYWGFIAEEIAEFDPRLVHWRYSLTKQELVSEAVEEVTEEKTIDAVLDDEGNEIEAARVETVIVTPAQEAQYKEVPDTDSPLEAEGVMYERIVVMLTAKIQELEARIKALEAK